MAGGDSGGFFVQNVLVMRHGDRIDDSEPLWPARAARPWDPPLAEVGRVRARAAGRRLRPSNLGFCLHRVVVSPFLRCLQTAAEVVGSLCAEPDDEAGLAVKVSIEYGLSEVMSKQAIRIDQPPQDGKWFPEISELEAAFPEGTVDQSSKSLQNLPHWEENLGKARLRYKKTILALADKYSNENILLVTHGEGVGASISSFMTGYEAWEVDFCAHSRLQRKINLNDPMGSRAEPFVVLAEELDRNGIHIYSIQEEMASARDLINHP